MYVFPVEEKEDIDLRKELEEFKEIEKKEKEVLDEVIGYVEGILRAGS